MIRHQHRCSGGLFSKGPSITIGGARVWTGDGNRARDETGKIAFEIKGKFPSDHDVVVEGKRYPLLRHQGFLAPRALLITPSGKVTIEQDTAGVPLEKIRAGNLTYEYEYASRILSLDADETIPDFIFYVAAGYLFWCSYRDST